MKILCRGSYNVSGLMEDWPDRYEDWYDDRISHDDDLTRKIAQGDQQVFHNFVRNDLIDYKRKAEARGERKIANVDKQGAVKHWKKMWPRAREKALERQVIDVVKLKENLASKGVKLSPKARVTTGFRQFSRKHPGVKQKAFYVTQGRKGYRKRFWGFL